MGVSDEQSDLFPDPALEAFLSSKGKGPNRQSGTYRRNVERDVRRFFDWLGDQPDTPSAFTDLSPVHLRQYVRSLVQDDLTASSVRTYYANLSAFLGWCVREGYLTENPAQTTRAKEPLPTTDHAGRQRETGQQTWYPAQRRAICRHADQMAEQALDAVEDDRWHAIKTARDRAFVYVLAYTGIRGSELLHNPSDDRRTGVTWSNLALEERRLTVLSKRQELSDRSIPDPVVHPLRTLERVLDPAETWPLFPTLHRPTLYGQLRDEFAERGLADTIERRLGTEPTFELFHEASVAPPSITTTSGRRIMRRLTDDAGIEVEDKHGYLAPHGARRGAGRVLAKSKGYAAAARLLDNTERVVRERYSDIEAGEIAQEATDAFERADGSGRDD